jgi:ferric-dicitrate binding protein FerR (iron transport regulator)
MGNECDRSWQVDAFREGRLGAKDAESFERHRRACASCARQMAEDEKLGALLRALPDDGPGELTLRRLRGRVMRDVATGVAPRESSPRARIAVAIAAVVVAAAGAGAWMLRHGPEAHGREASVTGAPAAAAPVEPFTGSVAASAGARWAQGRADGVERVLLDDGTIDLHVRRQLLGERFLVALPDGELEVRGTTFTVTVEGGVTRRVHVDEGVVELRLNGAPAVRLGANDSWPAPPASAPSLPRAPAPRPAVAATTASERVEQPAAPSESSAPTDDGTSAYAAAMQRLRDGDDAEAASAFHAFLVAYPRSPMAEDASFLEAVALARAGRGDAAALAAEHHLASFPGSFHRKEASILVARAATSRGDCGKARAVLAPWSSSSDANVRAALRPCAPTE